MEILITAIAIVVSRKFLSKLNINLRIFLYIGVFVSLAVYFTIDDMKPLPDEFGWEVSHMNYSKLHENSTGESQTIALIDTGISEWQIEDNRTIIVPSFENNYDENGHGTMMYSLLKGYPSEKVKGIAPDVKVLSIKIMQEDKKIDKEDILSAIKKAVSGGATVVNLSLGSYQDDERIIKAINEAMKKGVTFVASAGDYEADDMMFPANQKDVIAVSSMASNLATADYTNAFKECTIMAPGDEIRTVYLNQKLHVSSGTSQATTLISGYVALLKDYAEQNNVEISNDRIIEILREINSGGLDYSEGLKSVL